MPISRQRIRATKTASVADLVLAPAKAAVSGATAVAAGMDFTVWLCGGRAWSAGNPQFGQLGHGTDHEYNASDCALLCRERVIPWQPWTAPSGAAGAGDALLSNAVRSAVSRLRESDRKPEQHLLLHRRSGDPWQAQGRDQAARTRSVTFTVYQHLILIAECVAAAAINAISQTPVLSTCCRQA